MVTEMGRKKLLVTGASGFLGWNVCCIAKGRWETYGTVFSHPLRIEEVRTVSVDLTDSARLEKLFEELSPDAVIHAAAASQPNYCELNQEDSYRINVQASLHVATLCAGGKIPCIFTSTDLVFNGLNSPYGEGDPVSPVNAYGRQKVLAEDGMRERYPEVLICRMPLMFGRPSPVAGSFIQPMLGALRQGREVKLFVDEFRTPISGGAAAQALLLLLGKASGQVLHLGGRERVSRYEFGRLLAEVLRLDRSLLLPCKQEDIPMAAPRPRDVSLDSSKAFHLGFNPPLLRDELNALAPFL